MVEHEARFISNLNVCNHIDGLVQERRNSSALAMELRLSCTNPSIRIAINEKNDQLYHDVSYITYNILNSQ